MSYAFGGVWNRGRAVGERIAFSPQETQAILAYLDKASAHHDACLFALGVDTMLRCSDLLRLRVRDLVDDQGNIRRELIRRQQKTGRNVAPVLTATSQRLTRQWIDVSGKRAEHFLFTREKAIDSPPISPGYYRTLIKKWASDIGLTDERYSSHSLRRTKPSYLYHHGFSDLEHIARLLGHATTDATIRYLGIENRTAQSHALQGDIFTGDPNAAPNLPPHLRDMLKPAFLDLFAAELLKRMRDQPPGAGDG